MKTAQKIGFDLAATVRQSIRVDCEIPLAELRIKIPTGR
jgi:hypothetical protein